MTTALGPRRGRRTARPVPRYDALTAPRVAQDSHTVLIVHLRALRGDRSLKDAAAAIGIRADELSKIEQGKTRQIRWDTILRIALAYQCGINDIFTVEAEDQYPTADQPVGPREAMLAALRAGAGHPVPARRLHIDREQELPPATSVAVATLAETPERGPIRRRFTPAAPS